LEPDFVVEASGEFLADIDPCMPALEGEDEEKRK